MQQKRGIKVRIYPTAEQRQQIERTINACRWTYNKMLEVQQKVYRRRGEHLSTYDMSSLVVKLKNQHPWLCNADSQALKAVCADVTAAYDGFFRRVKRGKKPGFPKFKSRKNSRASYTTTKGPGMALEPTRVKIPCLGWVRASGIRMTRGTIKRATVFRSPTGKYYASFLVEEDVALLPEVNAEIGIDLGIKSYLVDSNGREIGNPKHLRQAEQKLAREQRKLSRKEKGSRNREKQRLRVAAAYEKVSNRRNDHLHKLSTSIVRENQVICVEDLNVSGMLRNHHLAKAIADASWASFVRMLEYKSEWYGRTLVKIPTFYPSSQTCSDCGAINREVKKLGVREWVCQACGVLHDRDENAAKNILKKGKGLLLQSA